MSEPAAADQFWRPRADVLRELLDKGLSTAEIRTWFTEQGLAAPSRQAIHRAKTYKTRGYPVASRPSYYFLWKEFLSTYDAAWRRGDPLVITSKMKELIDLAEHCITQDQTRKPVTKRKRKAKR